MKKKTLSALKAAVTGYHLALDSRANKNLAAKALVNHIQDVLGVPWIQGKASADLNAKEDKKKEAALRKSAAQHFTRDKSLKTRDIPMDLLGAKIMHNKVRRLLLDLKRK